MQSDKFICGFDVRVIRDNAHPWPPEYLLRPDIESIFSVDPMVFPVAPHELIRRSQLGSAPKENIIGLLSDIPLAPSKGADECKIAVTIDREIYEGLINKFGRPLTTGKFSQERDLIPDEWAFLGYDVVDLNGLISGLLNCGPLHQQLTTDFSSYINAHSLFNDYLIATAYANRRALEIPAHSPFLPAAIWKKSG